MTICARGCIGHHGLQAPAQAFARGSLRQHRLVTTEVRVLRFRPGPAPYLPDWRIKQIALKAAAGGHPTLIQHAEGLRFEANLLAGGDLVFDWHWAYLIAIKGQFKLSPSSGPAAPTVLGPTGKPASQRQPHKYSVITIVLDAKTGQSEDFGTSNRYPDLAKLGPVTTDYRR